MNNGKNIKMYKFWKGFFLRVIAILIIFSYFKNNYAINITNSIDRGIYKLQPVDNISKGDIVVFTVSDELSNDMLNKGYLNKYTKSLIKIVAGMEGDVIEIGDKLVINGEVIKEKLYKKDSLGKDLPLKEGKYILKENEYFVIGTHERSFDSSYIGAIKKDQIKNKAKLEIKF